MDQISHKYCGSVIPSEAVETCSLMLVIELFPAFANQETSQKGFSLAELLRGQVWLDPGVHKRFTRKIFSLFPFTLLQILVALFHFQAAYLF